MGRRKKRRGGRHSDRGRSSGRVTARGTRPEDRRQLPASSGGDTGFRLDLLLNDARHIVETCPSLSDVDEVDDWASAIQCDILSSTAPGGLGAQVVLSHAVSAGGSAGATLAAALAAYGPANLRDEARRAVARVTAGSDDSPAWLAALGAAEPVRAVMLTDEWAEHRTLAIDFRRPGAAPHRVRIGIHPFRSGMAHPIEYFAAGDQSAEVAAPGLSAEEISLADARAAAEPALEILEEAIADDYYEGEADHSLDPARDLFALVRQRIGLLPAGGSAPERPQLQAEEIAVPFGEFASRPLGYGEDADSVHHLMRSLVGFVVGRCWDVDPLRWTPPRIAAFVDEWLPDHGYYCYECRRLHEPPSYEEWMPTFRSAFVRWLRLTAASAGLPDDIRDANLTAARASLKKLERRVTGTGTLFE